MTDNALLRTARQIARDAIANKEITRQQYKQYVASTVRWLQDYRNRITH